MPRLPCSAEKGGSDKPSCGAFTSARRAGRATSSRRPRQLVLAVFAAALLALSGEDAGAAPPGYELNDGHFHLTNYVQEGTDIHDFLEIMGTRVWRVALFGIPLQQQWSHRVSGDVAPTYYLDADSDLYYYSFTDAYIATEYLSLSERERERFDPMITGFNPADMYAADHIRRVLETFPGVFSGIGEFTVHKEFVSAKIAGDVPSLSDPAIDRIFDFAAEVGLVVILHNDIHMPFAEPSEAHVQFHRIKQLFARHPKTVIIWAHTGLGRVIQPVGGHVAMLEEILDDPDLDHVHFDISWNEMAKYAVSSPAAVELTAGMIEGHPDRFLFGTDEVAPQNQHSYLKINELYGPLWNALTAETKAKVRIGNYERLFDEANRKVRAWEAANVRRDPNRRGDTEKEKLR